MGYPVKTFDDIVASMMAWITANSSTITDFSPGSLIRSFCEATGLQIEEVYVAIYLGFQQQLTNIPNFVFNLTIKEGAFATTNLVFGRTGAAGQNYPIGIGTSVQTTSGLVFTTTASGQIGIGNSNSDPIPAIASKIGFSYNVSVGTLITLVGSVNGVTTVTNPNSATGGTDAETPYQYNQRFQEFIEGLGKSNISGLIFGALSVTGITSASVLEYFPAVANVNVNLFVDNGQVSGVSAGLLAAVQFVIDGDGTAANPGYRAAGVNVVVEGPVIVTVNVTGAITVLNSVDQNVVLADINNAITNYINSQGVGSDIIYNELIANVMDVFGVTNCAITVPSSDTNILASQVGRVGNITFAITA